MKFHLATIMQTLFLMIFHQRWYLMNTICMHLQQHENVPTHTILTWFCFFTLRHQQLTNLE